MTNNTFTEQIQFFVQRRNLPVEQLATLSNLSSKTIYRWVHGRVERPRHWSQIVALGKALRLNEKEVNQLLWITKNPGLDELKNMAQYEYEHELLEEFSTKEKSTVSIPRPQVRYDTWAALEAPAGAVRPESPFYIERDADTQLRHQVSSQGTTTTIQAGRQTGKTSLLMHTLHTTKPAQAKVIYLDFQLVEDHVREDLTSLLQFLSEAIAEQLDLDLSLVDTYWQAARNPAQTFNRFLQKEVLQDDRQILLAIDEADLLLDAPYKKHFFALLRAWDSRRAFDADWRKLNLVMVISTHPYLLIDDVNLSPFNVGINIHLKDFTLEQVADLNLRHGSPVSPKDVPALMDLVGGHPYLTRQALYTLVNDRIGFSNLTAVATSPEGPFSKHLLFYRHSLNKNPALQDALEQILHGKTVEDEARLERLAAVGLLRQEGGKWQARCELYEKYFA